MEESVCVWWGVRESVCVCVRALACMCVCALASTQDYFSGYLVELGNNF